MANKPLTAPCGSFSAIHAGCPIGGGPDEQLGGAGGSEGVPMDGQVLLVHAGVTYTKAFDAYDQATPFNPPVAVPAPPVQPAIFPPGPPFGH